VFFVLVTLKPISIGKIDIKLDVNIKG